VPQIHKNIPLLSLLPTLEKYIFLLLHTLSCSNNVPETGHTSIKEMSSGEQKVVVDCFISLEIKV